MGGGFLRGLGLLEGVVCVLSLSKKVYKIAPEKRDSLLRAKVQHVEIWGGFGRGTMPPEEYPPPVSPGCRLMLFQFFENRNHIQYLACEFFEREGEVSHTGCYFFFIHALLEHSEFIVYFLQCGHAGSGVQLQGLTFRYAFLRDTLVMRSEKRGLIGILNFGPGEKGSSRRVYLQVYASDFYGMSISQCLMGKNTI